MKDATILFGKNSSGKSLLLRKLLEQYPEAAHYTSPEQAGSISYDQNIMSNELNITSRGSQRRGKNQAPQFRQESISRIGTLKMKIGDIAGRGQNTKPIFNAIEDSISTLLPEFKFKISENTPFYELIRIPFDASNTSPVQVDQLSSGEAEMLTLALDLLTICNIWLLEDRTQRLLLVDEPDTHLHPDLQVRLAQFLIELIDTYNAQLIVATHSTTLLSSLGHFGRDRVGVVYINNSQGEQNIHSFDGTLRELSTCLGGHALMGPLFGAPLLLVEGDDDYRIWSQIPRHPAYRRSFAAIPCNGEEIYRYQKTLESLFSSLRSDDQSPAGYALLDGDKHIPTHVTQNHVQFIKLNCHEAENLYLSNEVLNKLGYTWAEASELILKSADDYGNHAERLKACENWNRENEDIKKIIVSVADILDKNKLHWTVRVGKTLGERPPVGQLSNFLGTDIVDALWG